MSLNTMAIAFSNQAQGAANGVHTVKVPFGFTIVGVSLCAEAFTGSPTGFSIDVQDDGSDVITGVSADTAGTAGTWESTHVGGSNDPVHVDADSEIEIDVNFSGGSSPTADYDVVLFGLVGTV